VFITFEGGEGAGKSTQARLLAEALAASGAAVLCTREPGGAPNAEILRALLLSREHDWSPSAEIYLHFAARAEHLARTIQPALARGETVVCDRFADSTMAYQGYGLGADRALIAALCRLLPVQPNLTIILQVSPVVATQRMAARHQALDRYEAMDTAFHARVAAGYAAIAAAEPARCVTVSADGAIEDVHQAVLAAVLAIVAERRA
jgi:dTMP kinase